MSARYESSYCVLHGLAPPSAPSLPPHSPTLTDGPAVMTDDGPSAKRRRLPGLEGALAQRALCEGAGPPPWLVQDMLTGETLEFDGRSGYHLAQARQVAGLYFRADRPLAVIAADGASFVGHNAGLPKLVKPSRERPEPRGGQSRLTFTPLRTHDLLPNISRRRARWARLGGV